MSSVRAIRGRRRSTLCATAALALVACLMSSCGDDSSSGLSQERAADLRSGLDRVEGQVSSGDCTGAAQQASEFRQEVSSLPARVDGDLRDALERSATRLESLVSDQCKPAAVETPPAEAPPTTDENAGDQQGNSKKDKKPKKEKPPKDEAQPPDTGATGQEGSTGVTGQDGGVTVPEGGG